MRWLEVALLLAPCAAFAAWWWLTRRGGAGPSPRVLAVAAAGLGALVAALIWIAETRSLTRDETYVPATWQDGRMIPGHGVP